MKSKISGSDELTIVYDLVRVKNGYFQLFDYNFVKNNSNNCFITINNKNYNLTEFIDVSDIKEKKLIIKLNGINKITDASYMFFNSTMCALPDIDQWDFSKVINMKFMFAESPYFKSLPNNISKLNTSNVTDMRHLFWSCNNLSSLPDISEWNTSNVTDISGMFDGCDSLVNLPDISNWNISKVTSLENLFSYCRNIKYLPNISK